MRYLFGLILSLGLLGGTGWAQPSASLLARRVSVAATDAPLQQVLRDIARQSGVPFSYSNTFIPLQKRVSLHTHGARPVGEILQKLFQNRGVAYQVIGGQVVLWRTGEQPPFATPKATSPAAGEIAGAVVAVRPQPLQTVVMPDKAGNKLVAAKNTGAAKAGRAAGSTGSQAQPASPKIRPIGTARAATLDPPRATGPGQAVATVSPAPAGVPARVLTIPPTVPLPATDTPTQEGQSALARLRQKAAAGAQAATAALARTAKTTGRTVGQGARHVAGDARAVLDTVALAATELKEPLRQGARLLTTAGRRDTLAGRPVAVQSGLPDRDTLLAPVPVAPPAARKTYDPHPWQVAFVAPLGSNWLRSGRSINTLSLNILAGYSAGVRGVELGGLLNVVRDTMQGVQAAGLANITGTEVWGAQAAGLVNIAGGAVRGVQAAGLINVVRDDVRGLQVAGLANVVGGAARSRQGGSRPALARQLLGLPRLLATDSVARHPSAPSATSLAGPLVQAAALANLTGTDVRGLQTATLLNMARRVMGVQFGLINVAKQVQGVQFGLINVADSVDGVTLGIINIVRHGYLHGEVWASETLPLNAALKLGVTRYYTILSAATQPFGSRVHWATGFGIGTASKPHGRFSWNLDLLDWYLLKQPGTAGTLLSYTQLRPSLVWQIEPQGHLGLVFSPTLNLGLYENDGGGTNSDFGKNQLLLVDTKSGGTLMRLWPGLQVGLRF